MQAHVQDTQEGARRRGASGMHRACSAARRADVHAAARARSALMPVHAVAATVAPPSRLDASEMNGPRQANEMAQWPSRLR